MKNEIIESVENEQVERFAATDELNGKTGEADRTQKNGVGIVLDDNAVLTDRDVMNLLDVKDNTLRKYRDEGYLPYRQAKNGDKRWYFGADIRTFLDSCLIEAYR